MGSVGLVAVRILWLKMVEANSCLGMKYKIIISSQSLSKHLTQTSKFILIASRRLKNKVLHEEIVVIVKNKIKIP